MNIVKAVQNDLVEVLFLLRECILDLNNKGLKHWNNSFPGTELIQRELDNGLIFLYKEKGVAKAIMTLTGEEPEEYKHVDWKSSNEKILYLLRLAVHPRWQDTDIARKMVEFAEKYAKENGYSTIRLDVFSGDTANAKIYAETGFKETGEFHSSFQKIPYSCYEKGL